MESTLEQVETENEYAAEGSLLHRHTADPSLSRAGLTPEQFELISIVEKAEAEFLEKILKL